MFCPLCKSEYRAGAEKCSDCFVPLVPTFEAAKATNVVLLWKGLGQSKFTAIVGALADAKIPNHAVSGAQEEQNQSFWMHVGIIGHFLRTKQGYSNMSWKVYVLESDLPRAQVTIEGVS